MRDPVPTRSLRSRHARSAPGIPAQMAAAAALGVGAILALRLGGMAGGAAAWGLVCGLFLTASLSIAWLMRRFYPHARIGGCNRVTLLRLALTLALLAPLLAAAPAGWPVALVATFVLVLDGVDGWLARRSGLVSGFGARFDVEVDAAFALVLVLHALAQGLAGPELLVLGLIRYVFVAAGLIWHWLRGPLPPSLRRKLVCVLQLAVLIVLQLPGVPADLARPAVGLAALALIWSFWIDIRWLYRGRC